MFIRHQFQWKTENMSKKRCLQHQIGMPSVWCWFKPAGTNRWVIRELLNSPSQQNNRRGLAISIHHVKILTVLIANDMQLQNHFCLMYFTHIERLTSWTNHHQPVCKRWQQEEVSSWIFFSTPRRHWPCSQSRNSAFLARNQLEENPRKCCDLWLKNYLRLSLTVVLPIGEWCSCSVR